MIKDLLLLISIGLILISYLKIIINYITTNKTTHDLTGFDIAKEITSNYEEINIVESKEINISKYNLKRRIIRLTKRNYDSKDTFALAVASYLSGYSLINITKDKSLNLLSNLLKNIDYLNKSSIITIVVSILATTKTDAKLSIILLGIILAYQYIKVQLDEKCLELTKEATKNLLPAAETLKIEKIIKNFTNLNYISFITTLILIIRQVLIILGI